MINWRKNTPSYFSFRAQRCEWNSPCPARTKSPAKNTTGKHLAYQSVALTSWTRAGNNNTQPSTDWQMILVWLVSVKISSHQTTIPLVFSDLLTQTVQLQLVDLQVWPDRKGRAVLKRTFPVSSMIFHLEAIHHDECKQNPRCVYSL